MSEYVRHQNNSFYMLVNEVTLHYFMVGVWCALSATKIIKPVSVSEAKFTNIRYFTKKILEHLPDYEKIYFFFLSKRQSNC